MSAPPGDKYADIPTFKVLRVDEGAAPGFVLRVTEGPDRGASFPVPRDEDLLIGTSPVCGVRLTDPAVSRRHASAELAGGRLRLRDLDSTNGIFLNGLMVFDVALQGGEQLRLGETVLEVARSEKPDAETQAQVTSFGRLLGASAPMRHLYPLCEKIAAAKIPVIIEGETGCGKEVLAEALHEKSPRAKKPFAVFDCTTVAPTLLEAALFGYERGAFTGADQSREGIFEEADGGTLFIDEIGDLDLPLQAKLLRALERSEVRRVGGDRWRKVDVRIIVATRRDLDREVQEGRFRDDLFFRLAVARVELPPLRKRPGDIALLARAFWRQLGGQGEIAAELLKRFESASWPGNVRELYNAVSRSVALGDLAESHAQTRAALAPEAAEGMPALPADDAIERVLALDLPLTRARATLVDEFERRYVARVLAKHDGNVTRAAAASGIARRYFQIIKRAQREG